MFPEDHPVGIYKQPCKKQKAFGIRYIDRFLGGIYVCSRHKPWKCLILAHCGCACVAAVIYCMDKMYKSCYQQSNFVESVSQHFKPVKVVFAQQRLLWASSFMWLSPWQSSRRQSSSGEMNIDESEWTISVRNNSISYLSHFSYCSAACSPGVEWQFTLKCSKTLLQPALEGHKLFTSCLFV